MRKFNLPAKQAWGIPLLNALIYPVSWPSPLLVVFGCTNPMANFDAKIHSKMFQFIFIGCLDSVTLCNV